MAVSNAVQPRGRDGSRTTTEDRVLSGNRIKSRPAKDAVISGILSQLGSLDSTPRTTPVRDMHPPVADFSDFDQGSRPTSPVGSFASAPNVPFSPGNTIRSVAGVLDSSDESFDDIATPPTVHTTRTSMRLSQQMTPRSLSYGGQREEMDMLVGSPHSSMAIQPGDAQKVLRADSWNKSDQTPWRTIRRMESHDTLRQAEPDKDFQPDQDFILNGLGSLATSPPPVDDAPFFAPQRQTSRRLGKSRLYQQESIEDLQDVSAADLAARPADAISIGSGHSRGSSAGPSTPIVKKLRTVSKASPIIDSVPLRTSSLRMSSSPVSTRRRPKPKDTPRAVSLVRTISEDTQDEQWAGLGDDDETVKRIRELRRKRVSRLASEDNTIRTARLSSSLTRNINRRSASVDPSDNDAADIAILGQDIVSTNSDTMSPATGNATSTIAAPTSSGRLQLKDKRPTTPFDSHASPERPLSLDYSYAHAVDALQRGSNNTSPERQRRPSPDRPASSSQKGMSAVRPLAFQHRRTTSNTSANAGSIRPKKQRAKFGAGTAEDGDETDGRRKSMSDARKPGQPENEVQRRDSVETAVLDYLTDARLSQHVLDPQTKRRICFSEVGDAKGAAVMVCVGMGLTRFVTAFFDELATTLRLRLITIERPGVGGSEPYPPNDRSGPLMFASDVTAVTEHLGISKFSMIAHSAGAVYALATALTLPHYVRGSIHLLAPWIPPSQLSAVPFSTDTSIPAGALPRSQRILRVLPAPFLRMANNSFVFASLKPEKQKSSAKDGNHRRTSSESPNRHKLRRPTTSNGTRPENPRRESLMLMDQLKPETNPMENFPLAGAHENQNGELVVERRRSSVFLGATINPNDPSFTFAGEALNAAEHSARERQTEFSTRLTQRTWEFAIKDSNPATDLLVCLERNREIGFRYTDVVRRVVITHGAEDKRVPVGNVKWLAEQMNRAVMQRHAASRDTLSLPDPGAEPGCELRVLEHEGHGLMASPVIMADILTEIAGYWSAEERGRKPSQNGM